VPAFKPRIKTGYLKRYAEMVSSAKHGSDIREVTG